MRLVENGSASLLPSTLEDIAELHRLNERWKTQLRLRELPFAITKAQSGHVGIQARNVAGFVQIGNIQLEVLPKFVADRVDHPSWRSTLWNFLAFGQGLHLSEATSGQFTEDDGLADLLAELFLQAVGAASILGFPIGYKEVSFDSQFLKGRIDPQSYGRLVPPTGKLTNLASRLTTNVPETQLLKWAGGELLRLVRSPMRQQALRQWQALLPDVESKYPGQTVNTDSRRYPHLADAFAIAQLLLQGQSVNYGSSVAKLPGFLWNSDRLFETVCFRLISAAVRPLGLSIDKPSLTLAFGDGMTLSTIPDIMLQRLGASVLSLDAKYKHLSGSAPRTSDVYQVMAVGRVSRLEQVGLVYPSLGKALVARAMKLNGEGVPKHVHFAEIGLEAFESSEGVRSLQSEITEWVEKLVKAPERVGLFPT